MQDRDVSGREDNQDNGRGFWLVSVESDIKGVGVLGENGKSHSGPRL